MFSGAYAPLRALSPLKQTHTCSHTIDFGDRTPGDAHFPCFCLMEGGAEMVWNRPVFSRGQTLARPEGGRHPIPPQREVMVWDPF